MESFISTIHIIVAVVLVLLVLVQDSKGGGLGIGGGTSSSVLGATGAENILAKTTRWIAFIFAGTCIVLTIYSSKQSAVDKLSTEAPAAAAAPIAEEQAPTTAPETENTSSNKEK